MRVTSEDAAIMYARACRAWYGRRAPRIVKRRIEEFRRAGDRDGVSAWLQVADQLQQLQMSTAQGLVIMATSRPAASSRSATPCAALRTAPHSVCAGHAVDLEETFEHHLSAHLNPGLAA